MGNDGIETYLNQRCRFILRSGKIVFGVIWRVQTDHQEQYVFASISDHEHYLKSKDVSLIENKLVVDIDDIVLAERLVG